MTAAWGRKSAPSGHGSVVTLFEEQREVDPDFLTIPWSRAKCWATCSGIEYLQTP